MLTETQIETRLAEGRARRNPIPLLQARAALIEQADALVQDAVRAGRGFTDGEDRQVSELLERAADIQREVAAMQAAFETAARHAHAVSARFS